MPRFPLLMLLVFALTLFCSATLLFMVEPMIGKMILPLLGGTPAVWNTCMVFFQAVLLLGYAYAHVSTSWLGSRRQAALHLLLLAVPFVFLPLAVNRDLIKGGENPIVGLLLLLSLTVGLPMFVVSASAPLLQKWFASTSHPAAKDPYFLYGASNFGSMLALVAYPTVVEPYLRLGQQSIDWTAGYGILAALTALCAVFLWRSPPNVEMSADSLSGGRQPPVTSQTRGADAPRSGMSTSIRPSKQDIRRGGKRSQPKSALETAPRSATQITTQAAPQSRPALETAPAHTLTGAVTWLRVLRWITLALVPSSLMLGATTYITTDIAAIPLLWVAPLALYLLSFIIVFSHVPAWLQWLFLTVSAAVIGTVLSLLLWDMNLLASRMVLRLVVRTLIVVGAGGGVYLAWWGWKNRNGDMLHRAMVLVMPLLVLANLFFIVSELKSPHNWIAWSLVIHLATLFVVSMVCHGELARDRPAAKYLTGYFLWMSVGGVLGGLFNALLAPLIFSGIAEYELAMLLACFLAPPLGPTTETVWGRRFDMILAGLFAGVGVLLIVFRLGDHDLSYDSVKEGPWRWQLAALILGAGIGVAALWRQREKKSERWMDLLLPLCLAVLLVGLSWGLWSRPISGRVVKLTEVFHLNSGHFFRILIYGVPIVLCYTFIERSLRFGLGVGAILLASSFCGVFDDSVLHQERSFFGVLKIEHEGEQFGDDKFVFRRLVHGTTLHGMQFVYPEDRRDEPLTYYHHTGPIGELMMVYNGADTPAEKMNLGVIGLGTGTMAAYARKDQHLTFYDIDPIVKRFSFDEGDPYFTYVADARQRGAQLELVMGDARLTMEKKQLKESEKYGVIVVDAFSSDAIPIHLITREAVQVYLDKLSADGLLCFHISNRYLDLKPVLYNLAQDQEPPLSAVYQSDDREYDARSTALLGKTSSTWVVLSRRKERLEKLLDLNDWEDKRKEILSALRPLSMLPDNGTGLAGQALLMRNLLDEAICKRPSQWRPLEPETDWPDLKTVGVWTDDYSNLLSVFSWR